MTADLINNASNNSKINRFIIQYQETDWQFLKRVASQLYAGIVPVASFEKPKFYFGIPEGESRGDLERYHYSVKKDLAGFQNYSENHNKNLREIDFVYYEVVTDQVMEIGDTIKFRDKTLYVNEAVILVEDGLLLHRYKLTTKGGFSQPNLYNQKLIGASVQGRVIEVAKDNVRVHLEVDENQKKEEAYWFPYSSVYTAKGTVVGIARRNWMIMSGSIFRTTKRKMRWQLVRCGKTPRMARPIKPGIQMSNTLGQNPARN
jgi:hypothetical protein